MENSWGADRGKDGFYTMNDPWFDQYVFEIAARRSALPAELQSALDAERAAAIPPPEEAVAQPAGPAWGWLISVALLALAAGFVLGWRLLDRRIRRKYGGLRIY